jgi:putative transposase
MPRGPRIVIPGVALHVVQRGHNRRDCFQHDTDYLVYLSNLQELSARTQCAVHAYCLMTNHVHLLLTPFTAQSCASLMRNLGQRYVQYFNRRYDRSGTLWEGRFHSCLVESAQYVLACHRYVERNPVRAGMVHAASEYKWSSHSGNAGKTANHLLTPHPEYEALGLSPHARHAAYETLCATSDEPAFLASIRDATNGGFALASERFKSELPADQQRRLARKPPGPPPAPKAVAPDDLGQLQLEIGLRPRTG